MLADLQDEYSRLNAARAPMSDLERTLGILRPWLSGDPRFVMVYAATKKRMIEDSEGAGGEAAFSEVEALINGLKDFELTEIGQIYRIAANTARRGAEHEADAAKRRTLLDRAEAILNTGQ